MSPKKLTDLTDQELLQEARKRKSTAIINALFIGFSVGIIVYSFMKNSLGLLTLIPLFIVYKLVNKSKYDNKELDELLRARNLN